MPTSPHWHVSQPPHTIIDTLAYTGQQELERAERNFAQGHKRRASIHLRGAKQLLWGAVEQAERSRIRLLPAVHDKLADAFELLRTAPQGIPVQSQAFWQRFADRHRSPADLQVAYGRLLRNGQPHPGPEAALLALYNSRRNWGGVLHHAPTARIEFLTEVGAAAYAAGERFAASRIFQHVQKRGGATAVRQVCTLLDDASTPAEQDAALQTLNDLQPSEFAVCARGCLQACSLDQDMARRLYLRAEQVASDDTELEALSCAVLRLLCEAMQSEKRPADGALLQAVKVGDPQLLFAVGEAAMEAGAPQQALAMFQRAAALAPPTPIGCGRIAEAASEAGDLQAARQWRQRAES